jgi:hypothetical protein
MDCLEKFINIALDIIITTVPTILVMTKTPRMPMKPYSKNF